MFHFNNVTKSQPTFDIKLILCLQILGPGSGWQLISLIDIVTSNVVKKAYRKATLYVHPDKLQQRGASIREKYICEKVFDLLKSPWWFVMVIILLKANNKVDAKPVPEPEKTIEASSVKPPKAEECDEGEDEDGDLKGVL
ncbi:hypothetical protein POM88_006474 [Heracleum sosnowskyi]|uniref:J domain-containing protein n=1 Tax=Heracleum sosnowskyi TaxID=360622 RepID=A0AAD8J5I6_9APIA|nr:hypothetical protein POM88_006474 [Heracleum sosnowskyi]